MFSAGKFVATPMEGRLRCAGVVEFAGLDAPESAQPPRMLEKRAREAFPGLKAARNGTWMGRRPASIDSLPFLGEAASIKGLYCGFGHHHIGLTGGPKTGRLLSDLISGRQPNIDLAPYRVDRFH
jgi:D-amino-acid dehydrogenase